MFIKITKTSSINKNMINDIYIYSESLQLASIYINDIKVIRYIKKTEAEEMLRFITQQLNDGNIEELKYNAKCLLPGDEKLNYFAENLLETEKVMYINNYFK